MIKVSIELTRSEANGSVYPPHTELIDKVSGDSLEAVKAKMKLTVD